MAIGIRHNSLHFKAFLFLGVIAGMLCDSSLADITKPKKSRPNFIIVFADDLGYGPRRVSAGRIFMRRPWCAHRAERR
ncbi:MAG: hypothetical protein ACYSO7_10805 [Planctomycetota bacterium]|jgi:hypothetical protein